jgi:hypothetical protein
MCAGIAGMEKARMETAGLLFECRNLSGLQNLGVAKIGIFRNAPDNLKVKSTDCKTGAL